MRLSMSLYAIGLVVLSASVALPAQGQDAPGRAKPHRRAPLRIEVTPSGQPYRKCVDWHVIEHRLSGDTVVPRMRCWWAVQ
jgi:hypothetical protein